MRGTGAWRRRSPRDGRYSACASPSRISACSAVSGFPVCAFTWFANAPSCPARAPAVFAAEAAASLSFSPFVTSGLALNCATSASSEA